MPDAEVSSEAGEAAAAASTEPKMLERLVCPVSRDTLEYDRAAQELISRRAGLAYPIRSGIPILLREEARDLNKDQP